MLLPCTEDDSDLFWRELVDLHAADDGAKGLLRNRLQAEWRTRDEGVPLWRCRDGGRRVVHPFQPDLPQRAKDVLPVVLLPRDVELITRLAEDRHDLVDPA